MKVFHGDFPVDEVFHGDSFFLWMKYFMADFFGYILLHAKYAYHMIS